MNLDRFSQPLHGETYFEEQEVEPVAKCEECGAELYEGNYHFETDNHVFCDKDCFVEYCMIEHSGSTRILEGK